MGDVVGHKEYSSEGKIDPFGIDMDPFRRDVQKIIDNPPGSPGTTPGGTDVDLDENAVNTAARQWNAPHLVRQVIQKKFYNTADGKMWGRAGLADIWNEVVWDGYVNPVDLLDGKDDPDINPNSANKARRGSLISYVLAAYRDAAIARRNTETILELLKAGRTS
ncbi:MAG: hypothetical protein U5O16_00905 [Rhodococcus sp. (in: high G+C Gram-positive bacteria)]|uniref:hypothetical protein n=1 Tax=Rhodococcus sp. TaxID=1831 RepID=UPI002ADB1E0C|nr:hypothetical protein [Rhodococcus sp. (in: high G+C Gram-positive bacteria)]